MNPAEFLEAGAAIMCGLWGIGLLLRGIADAVSEWRRR